MRDFAAEAFEILETSTAELRDDLWAFFNHGVPALVAFAPDRLKIATVALAGLELSTELVEQVGQSAVHLPIGCVVLRSSLVPQADGYLLSWQTKLRSSWLQDRGAGALQSLLDCIGNVGLLANRLADESAQFGGYRITPEDAEWPIIVMSTM